MAKPEDIKAPVVLDPRVANSAVPFGDPVAEKPGVAYTQHERKDGKPIVLKITTFGHKDDPRNPTG